MRQRMLRLVGVAAVLIVAALVSAAGQAPKTTAPAAKPAASAAKTSWGEPDLQGIWTDDFNTPLQRPVKLAGKEFLTDKEVADLDAKRESTQHFGDRLADKGTEADVAGAYNAVFTSQKHTSHRTALIVDPPDGRIPPFTPQAQKMRGDIRAFQQMLIQATATCKDQLLECIGGKYVPEPSPKRFDPIPYYSTGTRFNRSDNPEELTLGERCMSAQLPDFGGFRQIIQTPGSISIFYDTGQGQGWERIIPLDGRPHLPPQIRQWWGDSRGHWEGNTLVVDVTNFSAKTDYQSSRENLHLMERWTRTGANTLEYKVTMDDPTTWTKPWTVRVDMNKYSDEANRVYKEPRCHEGNYGTIGILSDQRALERAFAEGRGPDPATRDAVSSERVGLLPGDEDADPLAE